MTEDDTPFKLSKTQTIFKNAANVSLRGTTYDASHMDKFLGSGYGEKSIQISGNDHEMVPGNHRSAGMSYGRAGPGGGGGSNIHSYLSGSNANTIRPSVSFVSMNR